MKKNDQKIRCPHCPEKFHPPGTQYCPDTGKQIKRQFNVTDFKEKILRGSIFQHQFFKNKKNIIFVSFIIIGIIVYLMIPPPEINCEESIIGMEFVKVQGGHYIMVQSDETSEILKTQQHHIASFCIGKYKVTNAQFVKFLNEEEADKDSPWFQKKGLTDQIHGKIGDFKVTQGYEDYPVVYVSWYEAKAFAEWLSEKTGYNFRLPTELEWEYACRSGGKPQKYSGGNDIDKYAWYVGNSPETYYPVKSKNPNDLGIYNMSGNVWELCEDIYETKNGKKVKRRGGSTNTEANLCQCNTKGTEVNPKRPHPFTGFRIVRTP